MKRIILIREYVLWLSIVILGFVMFYSLANFNWLKTIVGTTDIYLFTIFMYALVAIEVFIRNKRLKPSKMKPIISYGIIAKSLLLITIIVIHILYWYLYFKNSHISIAGFMGISVVCFRLILMKKVYISNKNFVVGNKMYFIENLDELIDYTESSFKVIINGNKEIVYCGSIKVKEKLIKEIKLLRDFV